MVDPRIVCVWSRLCAVAIAGAIGLAPEPARADKISNAMAECRGKVVGDACSLAGEAGACVTRSVDRGLLQKKWIECSPGERASRKHSARTITKAGPVGVLPSAQALDEEMVEAADAEETGAAPIAADAGPSAGEPGEAKPAEVVPAEAAGDPAAASPGAEELGGEPGEPGEPDAPKPGGAAAVDTVAAESSGCGCHSPADTDSKGRSTPTLMLMLMLMLLLPTMHGRRRKSGS